MKLYNPIKTFHLDQTWISYIFSDISVHYTHDTSTKFHEWHADILISQKYLDRMSKTEDELITLIINDTNEILQQGVDKMDYVDEFDEITNIEPILWIPLSGHVDIRVLDIILDF